MAIVVAMQNIKSIFSLEEVRRLKKYKNPRNKE